MSAFPLGLPYEGKPESSLNSNVPGIDGILLKYGAGRYGLCESEGTFSVPKGAQLSMHPPSCSRSGIGISGANMHEGSPAGI